MIKNIILYIFSTLLYVANCQATEVIITQEFKSNTHSDWNPTVPTSKTTTECTSLTNGHIFTFVNAVQSANGKYLIIHTDGKLILPKVEGKIHKLEICLHETQSFSSLCNIMVNNELGNNPRYFEIDGSDDTMLGKYIEFPYDLSMVYPEEETILSISADKKLYVTGIKIYYTQSIEESLEKPRFILPDWISDNHYFNRSFQLSIESDTDDADILYSIDDNEWEIYTAPITISQSCNISAKAVKGDRYSEIATLSLYYYQNLVADIAEFKETGKYAESKISDNYVLTPNEEGFFTFDFPLQVINQYENRIFVTDNSNNFHNCITIFATNPDINLMSGDIIASGVSGYYIMLDGQIPALYTDDKMILEETEAYITTIHDIISSKEEFYGKFVGIKNIYISDSNRNITDINSDESISIENLFGIEINKEGQTDITGIISYSKHLGDIVILPLSLSTITSVNTINSDSDSNILSKHELTPDMEIYTLDGKITHHQNITPGIYIIRDENNTIRKAIIR